MYNKECLAKRVKQLRTGYGLSMQELSDLTTLAIPIGGAAIGHWESLKRIPMISSAQSIADLFAVSLDWLAGRIDTPYQEELLEALEEAQIREIQKGQDLPESYTQVPVRQVTYSQDVRANLVFFWNCRRYEKAHPESTLLGLAEKDWNAIQRQLLEQRIPVWYLEKPIWSPARSGKKKRFWKP